MKWVLFTIIFAAGASISSAAQQTIKFTHYTTEHGLPNNYINCIMNDRLGYIWIGTQQGLVRYDGTHFKVFRNIEGDSSSISSDRVVCLFQDADGDIWIGTEGDKGLNMFDIRTERFHCYDNKTHPLFDNNVVSIYQSIDKRLWFGSWNGLTIFNKKTRQVERHLPDPANNTAINQVPVFSIIEDDNKNIWLSASDQYIYLYREKTRDFEKYDAMTYGCYLKRIFKIPGNRFLITHYGEGVPVFDPRTKQIIDTLRKKHDVFYSVRAMIIDPNGNYWLGCDGDGISIFNPATKSSLTLRYDAYNTSSISSDGIYNLCLDSRGIVWAGTYNKGLNVYDPSIYKFELFENNLSDNASISGTPISTIYEDKHGRIWLGTDGGGLMLFDTRENTFRHYRYATDDPTSISTNTIISICEDNSGNLLLGTWNKGLNIFNPETGTNTRKHSHQSVWTLLKASDNTIYAGFLYTAEGFSFQTYNEASQSFNPPLIPNFNQSVNTLMETKNGNIWIGTQASGVCILKKDKHIDWLQYTTGNKQGISHNDIRALYEDAKGIIWIGTGGAGFDRYDPVHATWKHYNENSGLISNNVRGILQDKAGFLWISTSKGISKFDPATAKFTNFDKSDGLQKGDFSQNSSIIARDGMFYFGGTYGLNRFYPDSIKPSNYNPSIVFSKLFVINKEVTPNDQTGILEKPVNLLDSIVLSYKHNMFSIEYSAMVFSNQLKVRYAYMLEGFDKDWNYCGNEHKATYTNIDPGSYTLRVRATNNDGVWSSKQASLVISILPPYWQTWWFRSLAATALAGIIFFLFKVFVIRKQKAELEQRVKQRTAELSDTLENLRQTQGQLVKSEKLATIGTLSASIAHEIKNPVNFIYSGIDSLIDNYNDIQKVFELIDQITPGNSMYDKIRILKSEIDFDELNDETLTLMKTIKNGAARTVEIIQALRNFSRTDSDEIREIDLHENINVTLVILKGQYKGRITIVKTFGNIPKITCYAGKLNQVFMNILDNAIQAIEGEGTITISTTLLDNDMIQVSIKDTGKGMSPEVQARIFDTFFTTKEPGKGTGLGLSIAKELVEMHHGFIEVSSEPGLGSEFRVTIKTTLDT